MPGHMPTLTSDEDARLAQLFKQLDHDGNGRIDVQDIVRTFAHVPEHHAKEFVRRSGMGRSGDVDFAEFVHYVTEHEKKLALVFNSVDTNRDGIIHPAEIKETFSKLGLRLSLDEARQLVHRIDPDGNLEINFREWRDYFMFNPHAHDIADLFHFWKHSAAMDLGEDTLVPDDFSETEMTSGMWWRHLLAGGVAGAVSRTVTAPCDRIKVFFQVHGRSGNCSSLSRCFSYIIREGGALSLWRGNGVNILKIAPESAIKFACYERIKRFLRGRSPTCELTVTERIIAGSAAGGIAQTTIYPLETLKTRLCMRETGQYRGIVDASVKIYRAEGFRAFYRGYWPNLCGILPYAGIDLALYETMKRMYVRQYMPHATSETSPSVGVVLLCGTASTMCGQLASYPFALVKTRLQANLVSATASGGATVGLRRTSGFALARDIIAREGFVGLYRGITMNFTKAIPAVSMSYVIYETCRQRLGVEMS